MLLFLLSFYLHYDLLNSEEINIAKFNESSLVDKHHQNLREAKSLVRDLDLEQKFKETSVLAIEKTDEELVSYDSSNNLLRSRKVRDDQKHHITKDHKKPPAEFLRSPQNHPYDLSLGLSHFPGHQNPPSVIESPIPNPIPPGHLLSLKNSINPDLTVPQSLLSVNGPGHYIQSFSYLPSSTRKTSKRPSVRSQSPSPDPIPPGHLISLRNSNFPELMAPNLLSVNGPGRYMARFSYSPSTTRKTSKRPSVRARSPSPDPIPPGHLKSSRDSFFSHLMVPQRLLSVNGPGRYIARFSYLPSSTRNTSKKPSVRAQSPSPDPIPSGHIISLKNSNFPDLMVPQSLLSVNGPGRYNIASFTCKKPSVRAQSPSPEPNPPVTLKNSELRSGPPYPGYLLSLRDSFFPHLMVPERLLSVNGPGRYIARFLDSPSSTKTTSTRPQVLYKEAPLKVHFHDENPHELKSFSPDNTPSISNRALSSRTHPRLTTPFQTMDVNSKTWLGEVAYKILKVSNDRTASSQSRRRSTVPATPRMAQARQYTLSTGTANTAQLFIENKDGLLDFTLPETTSEDPNKKSKPTIAGDVLHGKIEVPVLTTLLPKRIAYNDEMDRLDEGYLVFFFIEMCRLIAVKNRSVVLQGLQHMEIICNRRWASGQLDWLGNPLERVIRNLLMMPPGKYGETATQARAAMMSHMLLERRQVLSPEVNSILDHAEMFFKDEDGERLLHAMEQFSDYPNTSQTSYQICDALMENLLLPFKHASGSPRRQQLVDNINKALQERFPHFLRVPHGETFTAGETPIGMQPRKRRRKQKRKGSLKHLPIDQRRFRAITTEWYRSMNTRPVFVPRDYELRTQRVLRGQHQRKQK